MNKTVFWISIISVFLFFLILSLILVDLARIRFSEKGKIFNNISHPNFEEISDSQIFIGNREIEEEIVRSIEESQIRIVYSFFVCDFDKKIGRNRKSMKELLRSASKRGVDITIFMANTEAYGNKPLHLVRSALPAKVKLIGVKNNKKLPKLLRLMGITETSFHHQKYLLTDHNVLVTGTDINDERAEFPLRNNFGYFWHEISVKIKINIATLNWFLSSSLNSAPWPLLNGGKKENQLMEHLILTSKESIHIEHQIFNSGHIFDNKISDALEERILRAEKEKNDPFKCIILTNLNQDDEPSVFTRWFAKTTVRNSICALILRLKKRKLKNPYKRIRFYTLGTKAGKIKVHTNFIISDSKKMIRTSTNLTDRCLEMITDTELGVCVQGDSVRKLQSTLLSKYINGDKNNENIKHPLNRIFSMNFKDIGFLRKINISSLKDFNKLGSLTLRIYKNILRDHLWKKEDRTWTLTDAS